MSSHRQSDRDMPKTPFKNGVTDLSCLNGQEYPGLVMLTVVAMKGMLSNMDPISLQHKKETIRLLFMSLSLNEQMCKENNTESSLLLLANCNQQFLKGFQESRWPSP